jgi:hypothetical protein
VGFDVSVSRNSRFSVEVDLVPGFRLLEVVNLGLQGVELFSHCLHSPLRFGFITTVVVVHSPKFCYLPSKSLEHDSLSRR